MERNVGKMTILGAMIAAMGGRMMGQAQTAGAILIPEGRNSSRQKRGIGTPKGGKRFGRERSWRGKI